MKQLPEDRRSEAFPCVYQTLVWGGQGRNWTSISDFQESASPPKLWLLFPSPIAVPSCRAELPTEDPEHKEVSQSPKSGPGLGNAVGPSSTPFYNVPVVVILVAPSSAEAPAQVPELLLQCMGSRTPRPARSELLCSALWQRIAAPNPKAFLWVICVMSHRKLGTKPRLSESPFRASTTNPSSL